MVGMGMTKKSVVSLWQFHDLQKIKIRQCKLGSHGARHGGGANQSDQTEWVKRK
jgi:hypothetical protein